MARLEDIAGNRHMLAIANAIRAITRTSGSMTIPEMPERLLSIKVVEVDKVTVDFNAAGPAVIGQYDPLINHLIIAIPEANTDIEKLKMVEPEVKLTYDIETGEVTLAHEKTANVQATLHVVDFLLPADEASRGVLVGVDGDPDLAIQAYDANRTYSVGETFLYDDTIGLTLVTHGPEAYSSAHNKLLASKYVKTVEGEQVFVDLIDLANELAEEIEHRLTAEAQLGQRITNETTRAEDAEEALAEDVGEVDDKLDHSVRVARTGNDFTTEGNVVTLHKKFRNLKTGDEDETTETMGLADSTKAGFMTKEQVQALAQAQTDIEMLKGQAIRLSYTEKESPTAGEIRLFVIAAGYTDETKWSRIDVVNMHVGANQNHVWRYFDNTDLWKDTGLDTVIQFTNEYAGVIKGAAVDGKVYAEADGTGSVYGWDALKDRVSDLESEMEDKANDNEVLHKEGAETVSGDKQFDGKVSIGAKFHFIKGNDAGTVAKVMNGTATWIELSETDDAITVHKDIEVNEDNARVIGSAEKRLKEIHVKTLKDGDKAVNISEIVSKLGAFEREMYYVFVDGKFRPVEIVPSTYSGIGLMFTTSGIEITRFVYGVDTGKTLALEDDLVALASTQHSISISSSTGKILIDGKEAGGRVVDVGSEQVVYDTRVFPKITRAKAKEIYDAYVAGINVLIHWDVMGLLPLEFTVIATDNNGEAMTFDIIAHDAYIVSYSFSEESTETYADVSFRGFGIEYATDEDVDDIFESEEE